jgi:cytochrome c oxidase subunit 3/cytochrome o ubiquinol oxidase subunit 3
MSHASLSSSHDSSQAARRAGPALDLRPQDRVRVGMIAFLISEAAFFSTLVVAYITYMHQPTDGPTPAEVLRLPLAVGGTVCLLVSSVTVHLAAGALRGARMGQFYFTLLVTIVLGALFLYLTGVEWRELIYEHHLTISRNLFGTTYFTLVGFHAAHVTVGVILLSVMFGLARFGKVSQANHDPFEVVSWYWHFVDTVWIVVFMVVYVVGR